MMPIEQQIHNLDMFFLGCLFLVFFLWWSTEYMIVKWKKRPRVLKCLQCYRYVMHGTELVYFIALSCYLYWRFLSRHY
jgi:hypothetical protein